MGLTKDEKTGLLDHQPSVVVTAADGNPVLTLDEAFKRIGYGWAQNRVLIVCGLCFMSDSIEVGLLSFLQIKAREEFNLSGTQEATLSAAVFAGELVGTLIFGPLADRSGRWKASVASAVLIAASGLASAFAVNYAMLVSMRGLCGIGIGGLSVPFDVLAEFVQPEYRGRCLMSVEYFWTVGTMFSAGMAWLMLDALGWRYMVGICSAPVVIALGGFYWLPESPRWLLEVGREADAIAVLRDTARVNKRQHALPTDFHLVIEHAEYGGSGGGGGGAGYQAGHGKRGGRGATHNDNDGGEDDDALLLPADAAPSRPLTPVAAFPGPGATKAGANAGASHAGHHGVGNVSPAMLFNKDLRKTTILVWIVWLTFGFSYYGTILIMPQVLPLPNASTGNGNGTNTTALASAYGVYASPGGFDDRIATTAGSSSSSSHNTSVYSYSYNYNYSSVTGNDGNTFDGSHGAGLTAEVEQFNYPALFAASCAEVFGCTIGMLLVDRSGRKWVAGAGYLCCALFVGLLCIESAPLTLRTIFVMVARAAIFLGSSTTWVMTPEVYPTAVRGVGHSWANGMARLGAVAAPYWGDNSGVSLAGRLALYGVVSAGAGAASLLLPETRGTILT